MMTSSGRLASQESTLLRRLEDALTVAQTIVAVGLGDEGEGERRRAVRRGYIGQRRIERREVR